MSERNFRRRLAQAGLSHRQIRDLIALVKRKHTALTVAFALYCRQIEEEGKTFDQVMSLLTAIPNKVSDWIVVGVDVDGDIAILYIDANEERARAFLWDVRDHLTPFPVASDIEKALLLPYRAP